MGVLAGFGWTSFFISALADQCSTSLEAPAQGLECAADVTAMVAALMDLGEASAGIATDCQYTGLKEKFLKAKTEVMIKHENPPQTQLGWCVVHPMQASYWLMRAALFLHAATKDCGEDADGSAIDALYVISSFGWAAAFLVSTVSNCGLFPNPKAYC